MVHTMVPMSVKTKISLFDPPARLINHMELCCAIGMVCRQASLPCPEPKDGIDLKEFTKGLPEAVFTNPNVNPKLQRLIKDYIYKSGETVNEDSLITMKLGYENPV